jgi:hypothetical protein
VAAICSTRIVVVQFQYDIEPRPELRSIRDNMPFSAASLAGSTTIAVSSLLSLSLLLLLLLSSGGTVDEEITTTAASEDDDNDDDCVKIGCCLPLPFWTEWTKRRGPK